MPANGEHDRDPPGKLITRKSVTNYLDLLNLGLDLAGAILLVVFDQVELAQVLGLSSITLRSVLRATVVATKR